jgi:hypothetical protein
MHIGEWRCSSTILNRGTRWRWGEERKKSRMEKRKGEEDMNAQDKKSRKLDGGHEEKRMTKEKRKEMVM